MPFVLNTETKSTSNSISKGTAVPKNSAVSNLASIYEKNSSTDVNFQQKQRTSTQVVPKKSKPVLNNYEVKVTASNNQDQREYSSQIANYMSSSK